MFVACYPYLLMPPLQLSCKLATNITTNGHGKRKFLWQGSVKVSSVPFIGILHGRLSCTLSAHTYIHHTLLQLNISGQHVERVAEFGPFQYLPRPYAPPDTPLTLTEVLSP